MANKFQVVLNMAGVPCVGYVRDTTSAKNRGHVAAICKGPEGAKNAALFAAAPLLLERLQSVLEVAFSGTDMLLAMVAFNKATKRKGQETDAMRAIQEQCAKLDLALSEARETLEELS